MALGDPDISCVIGGTTYYALGAFNLVAWVGRPQEAAFLENSLYSTSVFLFFFLFFHCFSTSVFKTLRKQRIESQFSKFHSTCCRDDKSIIYAYVTNMYSHINAGFCYVFLEVAVALAGLEFVGWSSTQ